MVKRLDVRRIRQSVGNKKRVHIRTFSGACIKDMDHYVKPEEVGHGPKRMMGNISFICVFRVICICTLGGQELLTPELLLPFYLRIIHCKIKSFFKNLMIVFKDGY
jgi:hypothetical protein